MRFVDEIRSDLDLKGQTSCQKQVRPLPLLSGKKPYSTPDTRAFEIACGCKKPYAALDIMPKLYKQACLSDEESLKQAGLPFLIQQRNFGTACGCGCREESV
jgi:hypothetical protein